MSLESATSIQVEINPNLEKHNLAALLFCSDHCILVPPYQLAHLFWSTLQQCVLYCCLSVLWGTACVLTNDSRWHFATVQSPSFLYNLRTPAPLSPCLTRTSGPRPRMNTDVYYPHCAMRLWIRYTSQADYRVFTLDWLCRGCSLCLHVY